MVVRFNFQNDGLTKPSLNPVTRSLANNLLFQAFCSLGMLTSARLELQQWYANKQTNKSRPSLTPSAEQYTNQSTSSPNIAIKDRRTETQPPITNYTATHPKDKRETEPPLPNCTAAKA